MECPQFSSLTKVSWRIFAIKGGMSIFHILRVLSMGHDYFSKLDSTFPSFASNISVVFALFTLNFRYVVADTISYLQCALYFSIICRDHAHISLAKWDLRIRFSVYDLEIPGSSPGVSNNIFCFLFLSFWPFTVPSPLIIKTRRIANNVINNPIYFNITLFTLNLLLFGCNPYGRWLFLKSGFYISVFLSDIAVISPWIL